MNGSWLEISTSRLIDNVGAIRQRITPGTDLIAVVKANAYGHGVLQTAGTLADAGIRTFGVANLGEAMQLRGSLPEVEILVLGGWDPGEEDAFLEQDLIAAVLDERPLPRRLRVEIKINTGMNRMGIHWQRAAAYLKDCPARIQGVFSDFASSPDNFELTRTQLERFLEATSSVHCRRHISNSGALQYREADLDAVRPGIALYGILPCPALSGFELSPVMRWKARVTAVQTVPQGEGLSYDHSFVTTRTSHIGVLPIGYADGYSRCFSNRGQVRVRGQLAPVVGRVTMDSTLIDLTDVPDCEVGEEVIVLEDDPFSPISARGLAAIRDTIPWEVLTSIGSRVERRYY